MAQEPDTKDRLFREIFDLAYDAILMLDSQADGVVDANQAALKLLGYGREELLELPLSRLFPESNATTHPFLDPQAEIGHGWIGLLTLHTRSGKGIWTETSVARIESGGKPYLIAVARRAPSPGGQGQEAELNRVAQLSMVREVAAALAHEVNQPLCAIVLSAQAAKRRAREGPIDETLADIVEEGHRASEVIRNVRQFLRPQPLEEGILDINETVREIYGLALEKCRRAGVSLTLDLTAGLPRTTGDRLHLQEVLLHLVSNAAEATDNVAGSLEGLTIATRAQGQEELLVAVTGGGKGVPAEDGDRIFDAFYTTKPGHLGLGLAISRSIVESHGGRISLVTPPDGGSVFQFSLPVRVPAG